MSSVIVTPSSPFNFKQTSSSPSGSSTQMEQLVAKLQQAMQAGDTQALQELAAVASTLLTDLDQVQANLTTSLASSGLSPSTASSLFNELSGVESTATALQSAVDSLDQLLGQKYLNGSPNNANNDSNNNSGNSILPSGSEATGSSLFNPGGVQNNGGGGGNNGAVQNNGGGGGGGNNGAVQNNGGSGGGNSGGVQNNAGNGGSGAPLSANQVANMLQNDPEALTSILNSLKAYVKGQAQHDLMDAIMNALEGGQNGNSQSSNSNSHGKSGAAKGGGGNGAPPVALNPGNNTGGSGGANNIDGSGNAGPTGTSGSGGSGNAGPTGTSGSSSQPNNLFGAGNNTGTGTGTGTATGSGSGANNNNGLTFGPGQSDFNAPPTQGQLPSVSSNVQLTQGGAQSGQGNTASLDGWDANLGLNNPGNIDEFLMMVLLACYEDGQKGLEQMAQQLQKTNNQKKALRSQLSGLYNQKTGNEKTDTAVNAKIQNVQGQLSDTSDDAQLQQLQLQNATQNQQQLLQEISSFSKNLYDASMNILRKIGS